ncbi:MAG TPA: hypothetical protein VG498_09430, partial [Terriglobales bacterium]|nr:hypothetical protein [Terriglobales bacterium]
MWHREVIGLLDGAAVAWRRAVRAQQAGKVPRSALVTASEPHTFADCLQTMVCLMGGFRMHTTRILYSLSGLAVACILGAPTA